MFGVLFLELVVGVCYLHCKFLVVLLLEVFVGLVFDVWRFS